MYLEKSAENSKTRAAERCPTHRYYSSVSEVDFEELKSKTN